LSFNRGNIVGERCAARTPSYTANDETTKRRNLPASDYDVLGPRGDVDAVSVCVWTTTSIIAEW